jgi:hypothetical protein
MSTPDPAPRANPHQASRWWAELDTLFLCQPPDPPGGPTHINPLVSWSAAYAASGPVLAATVLVRRVGAFARVPAATCSNSVTMASRRNRDACLDRPRGSGRPHMLTPLLRPGKMSFTSSSRAMLLPAQRAGGPGPLYGWRIARRHARIVECSRGAPRRATSRGGSRKPS